MFHKQPSLPHPRDAPRPKKLPPTLNWISIMYHSSRTVARHYLANATAKLLCTTCINIDLCHNDSFGIEDVSILLVATGITV